MASTIGLSAYTFRLRKRHAQDVEWLTLSRNGEVDAWEMFHRYLLDRKNQVVDLRGLAEESGRKTALVSKAFKLTHLVSDANAGTFAGTVQTGDYGRASDITNVRTGDLAHRKSV